MAPLAAISGFVGVCTNTRRLSRVLGLQLLHIPVLMRAASLLRTASLLWHENFCVEHTLGWALLALAPALYLRPASCHMHQPEDTNMRR